uniref:HDC07838 n=1 Tax=Drosophila melanogaster TaxID=7227 RepID=Q6IM13_DROME|nr:TPA_inf: HDC07838 [Drosophila melanogaster]
MSHVSCNVSRRMVAQDLGFNAACLVSCACSKRRRKAEEVLRMGCFYNEVPISLSYSLKVELAMVLGSELGLRLRVQRKLVNPLTFGEGIGNWELETRNWELGFRMEDSGGCIVISSPHMPPYEYTFARMCTGPIRSLESLAQDISDSGK